MSEHYVIAANAAAARFFRLEAPEFPELESGPVLVEDYKMQNPEAEMPGRDVFSAPKSGRNREPVGGSGAGHGYDDHREEHRREMEKQFAEKVGGAVARRAGRLGASRVILVATARMLGLLRSSCGEALGRRGLTLLEYDGDLVNLSPTDIQRHLARKQLVPPKKPPQGMS